jgi:hypothetical protein
MTIVRTTKSDDSTSTWLLLVLALALGVGLLKIERSHTA